jgi:hypothetical protein
MRRRLAVAAGGWALAATWSALAQRPALPAIGYLSGVSRAESETRLTAFRRGQEQAGFHEGGSVALDIRWADGDYGRLAAMAADLVCQPVNLIAATGGPRAAQAARATTSTVPIVFVLGGDPVKFGLLDGAPPTGARLSGKVFKPGWLRLNAASSRDFQALGIPEALKRQAWAEGGTVACLVQPLAARAIKPWVGAASKPQTCGANAAGLLHQNVELIMMTSTISFNPTVFVLAIDRRMAREFGFGLPADMWLRTDEEVE